MSILGNLARGVGSLFNRSGRNSGVIMLAAPVAEDPYSPEKLKAEFMEILRQAYEARATAIRLQNDKPAGWVQFVVSRQWVPQTTWDHAYATKFIQNAYGLCDNRGTAYQSGTSQMIEIDKSKMSVYGSMETLYLAFSPLAGDRQQLLIHIVYDKPQEAVA